MGLTGTHNPLGTITSQESVYVDSAPDLWIQDARGSYRYGPDSDGLYWGLSGTATYPVYKIGCFSDMVFGDNVTMNEVLCDASGVQGVVQNRNMFHLNFTLKTLFPLSVLQFLIRTGTVVANASDDAEKMPLGETQRKNTYWHVFFSKVYDSETGAFVSVTLHRCQFVGEWEMGMAFGEPWSMPIQINAFADPAKPVVQKFGVMVRVDPTTL
jgi:hypothetical protein